VVTVTAGKATEGFCGLRVVVAQVVHAEVATMNSRARQGAPNHRTVRRISQVLSPPIIGLAVVIIFAFFSPIGTGLLLPWQSLLLGIVFIAIGPVLPLSAMVALGRQTFDVENRRDRPLLYLAAILVYAAGAVIAWFFQDRCMATIAIAYVAVTSAVALISLFWKVSAHTAGVAGPITALTWVYGLLAAPFLLLAVLVGWARRRQGFHTVAQVAGGIIIAILVTAGTYWVFWPLPP
jgi:membrane-associated phospholipid phosphatase